MEHDIEKERKRKVNTFSIQEIIGFKDKFPLE
jgi:hypothetical protein